MDDLCEVMLRSLDFDRDHMYQFCMDNNAYSRNAYISGSDRGGKASTKEKLYKLGLKTGKKFLFIYDFGDDWEHVITVEERFDTGSGRFRLLEMRGERPPEDVGGEGGFEDYMRILSNPDDPEYESTVRWAEGTKAKPESMEAINKKLGWLI